DHREGIGWVAEEESEALNEDDLDQYESESEAHEVDGPDQAASLRYLEPWPRRGTRFSTRARASYSQHDKGQEQKNQRGNRRGDDGDQGGLPTRAEVVASALRSAQAEAVRKPRNDRRSIEEEGSVVEGGGDVVRVPIDEGGSRRAKERAERLLLLGLNRD